MILEACLPNFVIHEVHVNTNFPDFRSLTIKTYDPQNGYLSVPEEPGIGNEWNENMLSTADTVVIQ